MSKGTIGRGACPAGHMGRIGALALALVLGGGGTAPGGAAELRPLAYHATVVSRNVTGSGFAIAEGVAVTNAHVLNGTGAGGDVTLLVARAGGTRSVRSRVLAVSPRMDLALLALPAGLLPVAPVADAPLDLGRRVRAAGVVAERTGAGPRLELEGRIASGLVTLGPFGPGLVAVMPGIRRGFSGGPVLDAEGRLVGMVAALRPDPGRAEAAAGEPMAGRDAFVLGAAAVREEVARLLEGLRRP